MFTLHRPSEERIRSRLEGLEGIKFSYRQVGATRSEPPAMYNVDRFRALLGEGRDLFDRAADGLRHLRHLQLGWVEVFPSELPVREGTALLVLTHQAHCYCLHAGRVVYAETTHEPGREKYSFAYGTLPGHAEKGEERFSLDWDQETDQVFYEILAFSRPRHPLAWLAYPWTRRWQERFRQDTFQALLAQLTPPRRQPDRNLVS